MGSPYMNGRTLCERLFSRLIIDPDTGCLLWTGTRNRYGYGQITMRPRTRVVHRVTYEMFAGPVPDGMTLDHLCRVRHCASPAHLEPVTNRENILRGNSVPAINARKDRCDDGHLFDVANTYWVRGKRLCRACNREAVRRYKARKVATP